MIKVVYTKAYDRYDKGMRKLTKKEITAVKKKVRKDFLHLKPYQINITSLLGREEAPHIRYTVKHKLPREVYTTGGAVTVK